ncbi:hypothetical protein PQR11_24240 [Paraburkholderia strydomiana]|uniref:ArnT family glycosyltransferase n=1 Tax=Paraburkholderia strydomiana TaxID=1245417 RepID=UPI0038B72448
MNRPSSSRFPWVSALVSLAFAGVIGWTFVGLWRYATIAPPSFDGAMNLRTAASFLNGEGYGFFYDRFFPFPAQTDGPFILPTALAFWIGGVTPFTGQVVNLIYIAAFVFVALALMLRVGVPLWLALFASMACVSMPGFVENAMNGYGEIPALTWFLSGILVLASSRGGVNPSARRVFWTGLLFGIAYLTKVVALVCVGPAMLVLFCVIVAQPDRWRRLFALGAGFVVPVLCWEIFRFTEIGSVRGYLDWWRFQLGQVRAQSGAQPGGASDGLLRKGAHHLSILSDLTGVPAALLGFTIVAPVVAGLALASNRKARFSLRLALYVLSGVVGLYFFWWIFISPTAMAWLRRIVDALLLLQCLVAVVLAAIWTMSVTRGDGSSSNRKRAYALAMVALIPVVIGQLALIRSGESITRPPQVAGYQLDTYKLAEAVKALPSDATIFGTGWWQAPAVALFSGRKLSNFEHWSNARLNGVDDKYFVADMYTSGIAPASIEKVLDRAQHDKIATYTGGAIYRLGAVQPYPPFGKDDVNVADLASGFSLSEVDYPHRRGFYSREEDKYAWAGPESAVMLSREGQTALDIKIDVPHDLRQGAASNPPVLHITGGGCLDSKTVLIPGITQDIHVPLICAAWPEARPLEVSMSVDQTVPFIVQIDSDNRLRTFMLRSMQLTGG